MDESGELQYAELFEASRSYRNVTASLWFDKKVSVLILGPNREAYEVRGSVRRILIAGRKFEQVYRKLREEKGFDIAAVVTITPEEVEDLRPERI